MYLPNGVTLSIDEDVLILPANDFSGSVFRIDDFTSGDHVAERIKVEGGRFQEGSATPSANWDLFRIESAGSSAGNAGIVRVTLRDIWAKRCRNIVRLVCTSGTQSFINGLTFDNLWADVPKAGFTFEMRGSGRSSNQVINRNHFTNCVVQADQVATSGNLITTHGFKDIGGEGHQFVNCRVWDIVSGQNDCNITNLAYSNVILGGIMNFNPVDWEIRNDLGARTRLIGSPWDAGENTALSNPFTRLTGTFNGWSSNASGTVAGDGLLNTLGVHSTGTYSQVAANTSGLFFEMNTGVTSGTMAAIRSDIPVVARYFNPFMKVKARLGGTSTIRFFVGFSSSLDPGIRTGDNQLSGLNGWGLGYSVTSTDSSTNWLFIRNNGVGAATIEDTGIAVNGSIHTFYLAAYEETPKVVWRLNSVSGQIGEGLSDLPDQLAGLIPGVWVSNMTAAIKLAQVSKIYLAQSPAGDIWT